MPLEELQFRCGDFVKFLQKEVPAFLDVRDPKWLAFGQKTEIIAGVVFEKSEELKLLLKESRWTGIIFAKRPQLCISMLHGDKLLNFVDVDRALTVFSDYRLPQLFLSKGIFKILNPEFEALIRDKKALPMGANAEV